MLASVCCVICLVCTRPTLSISTHTRAHMCMHTLIACSSCHGLTAFLSLDMNQQCSREPGEGLPKCSLPNRHFIPVIPFHHLESDEQSLLHTNKALSKQADIIKSQRQEETEKVYSQSCWSKPDSLPRQGKASPALSFQKGPSDFIYAKHHDLRLGIKGDRATCQLYPRPNSSRGFIFPFQFT